VSVLDSGGRRNIGEAQVAADPYCAFQLWKVPLHYNKRHSFIWRFMSLSAGTRLGPYEIRSALGAGGMGEVYRARDTTLNRDVAIKVLPDLFANDQERLARFRREAQVLAALNHPNIAHIHGFEDWGGIHALVMELVEGPTIADRIARGPIPLDEALPIARQIADALEAAHEQGIIHRDLKPANIKLRPDGIVKVLDFGLAKARKPSPVAADVSQSPTITSPAMMTGASVILGTAAYMAPEQAKGRAADKRGDVWAFGCVLYEMVTGKRAFEGEDVTDTLAFVLTKEPDWTALPPNTSSSIHRLLRRCLVKDRKGRLADIADARLELEDVGRFPIASERIELRGDRPLRSSLAVGGWIAASVLAAVTAGVGWQHLRDASAPSEPVRFQIFAPQHTTGIGSPVLSPDGRRLAFPARGQDGRRRLWIRSLDSVDARPLGGTEDVVDPVFWSPDSRFIGFATGTSLKKVDVTGKPPITLCDRCGASSGLLSRGGAWSRDAIIVYAAAGWGLWRIPEGGGVPARVGAIDTYGGYPTFLPDGRHFLYSRLSGGSENNGVVVGSVDSTAERPNARLIIAGVFGSGYVPSRDPDVGYLLFVHDSTLMAQPFDARRLTLTGEAVSIAEHVPTASPPMAFSASASGTLAFKSADLPTDASKLAWFDREGKSLGLLGQPGLHGNVSFSPDGKRLVVDRIESDTRARHVWTIDVSRGVFSRVNPSRADDYAPAVSADGRVVFTSGADLYVTPASGAMQPEVLFKSPTVKHANDWSPDGRFLLFDDHHPTQQQDLWILPLVGDRKPIPLLVTAADEAPAHFSPDGKWVAYSSDESGRREIYVRDFAPDHVPAVGFGKWQISTAGGDKPRWRRDGKELYYIVPAGKLMAVAVKTAPTFEPAVPVPLFDVIVSSYSFFPYDIAADGRFLINIPADPDTSTPITVVLNWMAALKK
jgi:eukaryotic-like serine/threonine-protein kinase